MQACIRLPGLCYKKGTAAMAVPFFLTYVILMHQPLKSMKLPTWRSASARTFSDAFSKE